MDDKELAVQKALKLTKGRTGAQLLERFAPTQMSFWQDEQRAIANELARSALFHCSDSRAARPYYDNVALPMLGEGSVTYKGEQLRTRDEDILLSLTHLVRERASGKMVVSVTSSELCKMNGWRQSQQYYTEIFKSIQRMKACAVTVASRRLAMSIKCQKALAAGASPETMAQLYEELEAFERSPAALLPLDQPGGEIAGMMLSLVGGETSFKNGTTTVDGITMGNLEWEITLEKPLVALFARPYLSLVDFKARQALSAPAKRLQTYYASHKTPYPHLLRKLEVLLGQRTKDLFKLKQLMTGYFEELREHGVIHGFEYEKSSDDTDWKITVLRSPPAEPAAAPLKQPAPPGPPA